MILPGRRGVAVGVEVAVDDELEEVHPTSITARANAANPFIASRREIGLSSWEPWPGIPAAILSIHEHPCSSFHQHITSIMSIVFAKSSQKWYIMYRIVAWMYRHS